MYFVHRIFAFFAVGRQRRHDLERELRRRGRTNGHRSERK